MAWTFGSQFRNPKTYQERRMAYIETELIRAKRRSNNIPNNWDDITRSDWKTHKLYKSSWKWDKKRKQYL